MNAISDQVPELFGGAADLTASTKTIFNGPERELPRRPNFPQRLLRRSRVRHVRRRQRHGGPRRPCPVRIDFLQLLGLLQTGPAAGRADAVHSIFVFTHDSIGLGEDGPTHQPIEQLMMLRAVPGMTDFRPADANETAACWRLALDRKGPSFFALTRQDLPVIDPAKHDVYARREQGRVCFGGRGGSEGDSDRRRARRFRRRLMRRSYWRAKEFRARVVSLPSWRIFEEQSAAYRASVLPAGVPKLAVEAGATLGWWKYVGRTATSWARPLWCIGTGAEGDGGVGIHAGERGHEGEGADEE